MKHTNRRLVVMEMSLSLEQEKKLLLENYSKAELDLFHFLIEATNSHFETEEMVSYTVSTRGDGSNG